MTRRILVIKLGALGDFIGALGPMRAIRQHHPTAHITLLTTAPFVNLAHDCGYFDNVIVDSKPKWHDLAGWAALRRQFNRGQFNRVYDLQNNDRTGIYLKLFSVKPEWVGIAKGASHRNRSTTRTQGRAYDGHIETLALAGITGVTPDTLSWLASDLERFALKPPYALLVPGSSPQHPGKRWPHSYYRAVAQALLAQGIQPVVVGSQNETNTARQIADGLHDNDLAVLDLTGQTDLADLATLARSAAGTLGNDTGPTHIAALTGCPTLVLYCSRFSTILKHGPLGAQAQGLEAEDLSALSVDAVLGIFKGLLRARL